MSVLWILCPIIAFGSAVDAIAGGGGLITLTAYVAVPLAEANLLFPRRPLWGTTSSPQQVAP